MLGAPFRLHGRDPEFGIDCVGLVAVALERIGRKAVVPLRYGMRNSAPGAWTDFFLASGFESVGDSLAAGDVIVTRPGPGQHHLMIVEDPVSAIHAHAGLRRTVRQPIGSDIIISAHWRLADVKGNGAFEWQR